MNSFFSDGIDLRICCGKRVTIHSLFEIRFCFVVLARKKQVLISNLACEAGTPHPATDRSIEDAAYVQSTDGLRLGVEGREQ